jgi:predicted TIM-barrel fold metal-dependent hydrolase
MLLNWWPALRGADITRAAKPGNLTFDIATVEGIEGVGRLTERVPASQIVFGSHAPFFALESALLKMEESGLSELPRTAILADNARRLLRARP